MQFRTGAELEWFETEPVQNRMGFGGKRCGIGAS